MRRFLTLLSLLFVTVAISGMVHGRARLADEFHRFKRDISDNYLLASKGKQTQQQSSVDNPLAPPPAPPPPAPKIPELDPCTVVNPASNGFFDLRELSRANEDGTIASWSARGWDYGMNFTLGICSTPVKKFNDGDFRDVANVSLVGGYYTDLNNERQSIGEFSNRPMFRGRKLTLTYENGSFCKNSPLGEPLRKSTILSFSCDRQIMAKAQVSFVGVLHDCDYFFEVKTVHACPTAAKSDNLALVWIFALILLAALFVFCGAGTLYRRFGRRGWRPLPSYGLMHNIKTIVSTPFRSNSGRRQGGSVSLDNIRNANAYLDVLDTVDTDSSDN